MRSEEIRRKFLQFFENKEHTIVRSAPVVPIGDPTLLFTNAGMNQFKDIFTGSAPCPYKPARAASVQKCIRVSGKHNDLEEVGRDGTHHTFFEMLGNWSFGNYFKRESIIWAWELLTEQYGLNPEKLYPTVFRDDDESAELWHTLIGIPYDKITRCGEKDNFWEMADTGPCGPTTEVHFDMGYDIDPTGKPNSSKRFVEIWNIVFMEFFRNADGSLHKLPAQNVDTGMGFERLCSILQNTGDNYRTDVFAPIIDAIGDFSGHSYDENEEIRTAFRVLADHIRALGFAIADGAMPGNGGRGYVLRRILRRAARFSRVLGIHEPILFRLVTPLVDKFGAAYPELRMQAAHVNSVIRAEEERFGKTLDNGIELFERIAETAENDDKIISGENMFRLYDTYGFPPDLTRLMAEERGLSVDEDGFTNQMTAQKQRARAAGTFDITHVRKGEWTTISDGDSSLSLCYETEASDADVRAIRKIDDSSCELVLSATPFYAESGGQIGDIGRIEGENFSLEVVDTKREGEKIVHICKCPSFDDIFALLEKNNAVFAQVSSAHRLAIRRNHTATHLLHRALGQTLGTHVKQAGSFVSNEKLRFDYSHFEPPTPEQLEHIEQLVNNAILADLPISTTITTFNEAVAHGAVALFGEKYGEHVRMVTIGDFSTELCGGTHLTRSSQAGLFAIVAEENVSSGTRRIEAVTGERAFEIFSARSRNWKRMEAFFAERGDKLFARFEAMREELENLRKVKAEFELTTAKRMAQTLFAEALEKDGAKFIVANVKLSSQNELARLLETLESQVSSGVIFIGAAVDDKVLFVCRITKDIVAQGFDAGAIVSAAAKLTGGGGGGRKDFAQAGGRFVDKLPEAIEVTRRRLSIPE